MCGCTAIFTCTRCKGTPADPRYWLEADPREIEDAARESALSEGVPSVPERHS